MGVQVNPGCQFTLLAAHLKSKNEVPDGDAAGLRLEEAKLLRSKIDALLVLNCIDRRYNICQPGACPEPHARLLAVRRTAKS